MQVMTNAADRKLNKKQKAFVQEYLLDLNATQAAIRAGYSEQTAAAMGHENLKKPQIASKIAEALEKRSERTQIDSDWLLERFRDEAVADLADLYTEAGTLKPIHEWPKIWRQGLVQGVDVESLRGGTGEEAGIVTKIKLSDRVKRLELIGRHVNVQAFKDRLDVDMKTDHSTALEKALARADAVSRARKGAHPEERDHGQESEQ